MTKQLVQQIPPMHSHLVQYSTRKMLPPPALLTASSTSLLILTHKLLVALFRSRQILRQTLRSRQNSTRIIGMLLPWCNAAVFRLVLAWPLNAWYRVGDVVAQLMLLCSWCCLLSQVKIVDMVVFPGVRVLQYSAHAAPNRCGAMGCSPPSVG